MKGDRLKGSVAMLARRADPLVLYRCLYRARVLAQSADLLRVDVRPDDALLPDMANIPLCHGVPGLTVAIAAGAYVMVGWSGGRPDVPWAALWANPAATGGANAAGAGGAGGAVARVALAAALVDLAQYGATEQVILGTSYRAAEVAMHAKLIAKFGAAAIALDAAAGMASFDLAKPEFTAAASALAFCAQAVTDFELAAGTFLSSKTRTG